MRSFEDPGPILWLFYVYSLFVLDVERIAVPR